LWVKAGTEIRKSPALHPLRKTLLETELLPYQIDGIAFAAGGPRLPARSRLSRLSHQQRGIDGSESLLETGVIEREG